MEPKLLTAERFVNTQVGCSYRYVVSSTEYFRPHYHDYYEVFIVLEGNALHCVGNKRIRLQPHRAVFIRPPDTHDYICENGQPFSMLNLTITRETVEELFRYLGDGYPSRALLEAAMPPDVLLSEREFTRINQRMERICAIDPTDISQLRSALRILLFELFTRVFQHSPVEVSDTPAWLETLCEQMERDGNFVYGTERMLALSGKTREHLARSLRKYKGVSPSEYINEIRLNYIANMLRNSNHPIATIVYDSGFNNLSWASQLFKKKYGIPMRLFRNG